MADTLSTPKARLAAFDAGNSPWGLLERYANGRINHFGARQILTVGGALSLAWLASPLYGLAAVFLALLGEAVDCLTLARVKRWRAAGRDVVFARHVTTITAGFQAITIGSCVVMAQLSTDPGAASFFALAFLTGAAMNAGLVLPYHARATQTRLVIYAAVCLISLVAEVVSVPQLTAKHGFDVLGAAMLAYMVQVFLAHVIRTHARARQERRDLLLGAVALSTANNDLQESQREARQLSLVARHANDSIVISHPDRGILWVNAAFTRITGYSLADARGKSPAALLNGPDSDPATVAAIGAAVKTGVPHRAEILNRTRDGTDIWVETNLVPLLDDVGKTDVVIAIERDITQTKDHARQLADAMHKAHDGARAKAAFLATMSHEIRTPMNGIIGMSELLAASRLSPDQQDNVATIHDSAEALLKIINDILDYSRLEANKLTITEDPFALAACLRSAVNLLRPQAREKGLYLDISHDTTLPDLVIGDSGRLRQVILNMLGNAIKFTQTGGVTLRVAAAPDGLAHHRIDITVSDTGIGIAPDRAEAIFEQFEQADAETTRKFGGTGLGLAISRQLARGMGGDLVLCPPDTGKQTRPGATFRLSLRTGRAVAQVTEPHHAQPTPTQPLGGLSLLVADDNKTNRHLISRYLDDQNITVHVATDGIQAISQACAHLPDVILMDMSMPELDGLSATRRIRALELDQPFIIALTANAFASDRAACMAAGMDAFLTKPVRKAQLLDALTRAQRQTARRQKPLGPAPPHRVSPSRTEQEAPNWTSQPGPGTTSGRSTRSSGP